MVDITKIVEKGMKDEKKSTKSSKAKPKKAGEKESTLDQIFGEKNPKEDSKNNGNVRFSKKLGDIFGVDEENDG